MLISIKQNKLLDVDIHWKKTWSVWVKEKKVVNFTWGAKWKFKIFFEVLDKCLEM